MSRSLEKKRRRRQGKDARMRDKRRRGVHDRWSFEVTWQNLRAIAKAVLETMRGRFGELAAHTAMPWMQLRSRYDAETGRITTEVALVSYADDDAVVTKEWYDAGGAESKGVLLAPHALDCDMDEDCSCGAGADEGGSDAS
jgi:hypothetical protein